MDYEKLSKEVSYALRHAPWEYELEMDEEGWVSIEQLLRALSTADEFKKVTQKDLAIMIDKSDKKRHEIKNNKIRAFYGHSIPMRITKNKKTPPDKLYHGTARRFIESIKQNGLLPMSRQYVHLSADIDTATKVGCRHGNLPCILEIDAKKAYEDGVGFYHGNEKVWLADKIPPCYILFKE